mmetsp:Transcript_40111/g.101007  ORF Transcript_40111/g.101007 Transcript_40111/m.101007 type:complete len:218 (-) Transcript_40111:490-1143(-)
MWLARSASMARVYICSACSNCRRWKSSLPFCFQASPSRLLGSAYCAVALLARSTPCCLNTASVSMCCCRRASSNGVSPSLSRYTVASCSSSTFTAAVCPNSAARCSAVAPPERIIAFTRSCSRAGEVPGASSSARIVSACPATAAMWSGVRPLPSNASGSAPALSSANTASVQPSRAAQCSGAPSSSSRPSLTRRRSRSAVPSASFIRPASRYSTRG